MKKTALLLIALIFQSACFAVEPVGDGIADDTAALQSIVDSGDDLILNRGTYRVTKPIVVQLEKTGSLHLRGLGRVRIVMDGEGPAIRLIGTHGGTAAPHTVKDEVWNRQNAPLIADLEIVGNHAMADGIELDGVMQPIVKDVTVRKTRHAIHLVNRNRNVIIRDCHLYENSGIGLFLNDVNLHQINVTGSHISYNAGGGIVSRHGNVRNLHITGCDIEGNMGDENAPATANVLLVSGKGSIGEIAITGCTIQHDHNAKDSANIRIDLKSNPVSVTKELRHGNVTISGNVLSDTQVNVHLKNLRGAAVTGNTIWKGYSGNILLENCTSVTLTGNTMDRNFRYHYGDGKDAKLGVRLQDCSFCVLSANIFNGVGERSAALELSGCKDTTIIGCTICDYDKPAVLQKNCQRIQLVDNTVRSDVPLIHE